MQEVRGEVLTFKSHQRNQEKFVHLNEKHCMIEIWGKNDIISPRS